ncbi:MAG: energy transducer TonB [Rhodospirillaceae bacterium]|nr:energy transducer TonB [Rhodospirillaceae bacterium]
MDESCLQKKDGMNGPVGGDDESGLSAVDASSKSRFFYPVSALFLSLLLHAGIAAAAFLLHDPAVISDSPPTVIVLTMPAEDGPSISPPPEMKAPLPPSPEASPPPEPHSPKAARPLLHAKPSPRPHTERSEPPPESRLVSAPETAGAASAMPAAPAASAPETELGGPQPSPEPADRTATYRLGSADTPSPPYPMSARRKAQQGQVVVRLTVQPSGLVDKAELVESSGVAALDRAALDTLRLWRLQPALRAGAPIASRIEIPIKFVLE